jgi:hypothetical protein
MHTPEDTKRTATLTFNAAADAYDNSALDFRDYFGRKTIEKLRLPTRQSLPGAASGH